MKEFIEYTEQDTATTVLLPLTELRRLEQIEQGCYITAKHRGRVQVLQTYFQMRDRIEEAIE